MPALSFPASPTVGTTYTSGYQTWQWDGTAWTLQASFGATGLTEAEIDFGNKTHSSKSFTVVNAAVTPSSKIVVFQSGNPATGRGKDDAAWDGIMYAAKAGTGQFTLYAMATGKVQGKRKVYYAIY